MTSLHSSVLIVGHPDERSVQFGADFVPNLSTARQFLSESAFPVIVLAAQSESSDLTTSFLEDLQKASPATRSVVISDGARPEFLAGLVRYASVFRVLRAFDDPDFERVVQEALEVFDLARQKLNLMQLVNDQNQRLRSLTVELEDRVQKRQKYLNAARKRLLSANNRIEALHAALMAVHKARSIGEMESLLSEALSKNLKISWTRIFFRSQSLVPEVQRKMFKVPLIIAEEEMGSVCFARTPWKDFSKDEADFLHQVADAIALSIDRLMKLEQAESLKQQWETTFDSISEALCLTDENFRILRTNRAFSQKSGQDYAQLVGKNCFASFFDEKVSRQLNSRGHKFNTEQSRVENGDICTYEVSTQPLSFQSGGTEILLVLVREITEQKRLETQILESAKMAELGTIGSSIAHELNNPVGGMISFLQLIQMDLAPDSKYKPDVEDMLKAAIRCKDIVENLLGFSRHHDSSEMSELNLCDVINQCLTLTELQTRPKGIRIEVHQPKHECMVTAQFHLLSQALRHILQNAQEAVSESLRHNPRFQGVVQVNLKETSGTYVIEVRDNGVGIPSDLHKKIFNPLFTTKDQSHNAGLGLTVAFKILSDHGGKLEISSQTGVGTTARMTLKRPDLAASRREFDGKI